MGQVPLRLSMGGGGTDLPSFYELEGGYWTSATISKFVWLTVNRRLDGLWVIKFSDKTQRLSDIEQIEHPIIRESLKFMRAPKWLNGAEINIVSDVPTRSGLGVSGAIAVSLLQILHTMKGSGYRREELAEAAYHVEHDLCGSVSTGKQDQYIAVVGGITSFEVSRKGHVDIHPLRLSQRTLLELNENLVLFGTGTIREKTAEETLRDQGLSSGKQELPPEKVAYFKRIKEIGLEQQKAMLTGNVRRFGELLHEHWQCKKAYSNHSAISRTDEIYEAAMAAGAIGGKSIGAGTITPFMLFYVEAEKKSALRDAMASYGLTEQEWRFVSFGSTIAFHYRG